MMILVDCYIGWLPVIVLRKQERIKSEFNLSYIPELRIFNVLTQRYEPLTEEMANDVPESAKIKGFRSMSTFPNEVDVHAFTSNL